MRIGADAQASRPTGTRDARVTPAMELGVGRPTMGPAAPALNDGRSRA